jgi:outer membrane lipoprotein carrier protein
MSFITLKKVLFWYISIHNKGMSMRLLLVVLLAVSTLFGATITLPENFQADFTQKITNAKKKSINYSGKVRFSNKTLLKWEYLEPTKKEVCTNGTELLVVDHDLEQVSRYLMDKGLDLPAILKSAKPHRKSVYIAKYRDRYYTIQVNNRQELSRIAYKDDLDNNVLIIFSKMKYGKKAIPAVQMKCNYPESYDRIGG